MTWEATKTALFSLAGLIGVGGLGWLVKLAIEKLLNHVLEKKLTDFKHAQSQEIEKLRAELHHLEDRGVRSNELEYQALIAAWESFIDAYHATYGAIGGLRERPDLRNMSETELDEWLENSSISPRNKKYIKASSDKNRALSRVERGKELFDCQKLLWEAQKTIRHKAVFIPKDIEHQFDEAISVLRGVWAENHVNLGTPDEHLPLTQTLKFLKMEETGKGLRTQLRDLVRQRVLHDLRPAPPSKITV